MVDWLASQRSSELFLSVVTIGEIERGILLQQTKERPVRIDLSGMVGNDPASIRGPDTRYRHGRGTPLGKAFGGDRS